MSATKTNATRTMFRTHMNSPTANGNLHKTREAAEKYLKGYVDGGSIEQVEVDFGPFTTEIYWYGINFGTSLFAAKNGQVRQIGTDGRLHEIPDAAPGSTREMRPPVAVVKRVLATRKRVYYSRSITNASGKQRKSVSIM
jgi:hypothetical protein